MNRRSIRSAGGVPRSLHSSFARSTELTRRLSSRNLRGELGQHGSGGRYKRTSKRAPIAVSRENIPDAQRVVLCALARNTAEFHLRHLLADPAWRRNPHPA